MNANEYVLYEIIHGLRTDMRMPRIIVQLTDMLRELFFSTACIITLKRRELSRSLVLFYYTTKVIRPTKKRSAFEAYSVRTPAESASNLPLFDI